VSLQRGMGPNGLETASGAHRQESLVSVPWTTTEDAGAADRPGGLGHDHCEICWWTLAAALGGIPMAEQRLSRHVVIGAAVSWLFVGALLLLELWPNVPQSVAGWVLFVAVGPPLYVLGEAFADWAFSARHGAAISGARFSLRRVLVALLVSLVFLAAYWWALSLIGLRLR
jgi:hypothetical protein